MKKYFALMICLIFFGGPLLSGCEESAPPPPPKPKIVRKKIGQIPPDLLKKEPDSEAPSSPQKNASPEESKDTTETLIVSNSKDEKEALLSKAEKPLPAPPPVSDEQYDPKKDADKTIDEQEIAPETESPGIKNETIVQTDEKQVEKEAQNEDSEQSQKGAEIASFSDNETTVPLVLPDKEGDKLLAYNAAGKIDPFVPLFKDEPKKEEKKQSIAKNKKPDKPVRRLTPLEKLDLDQLKLVGIVWAESGSKALVEETSGKGYIITKGTYIGIHSGRVVEIQKDKIVVEEKDEDEEGNQTTHKRELKFQRPDGDDYYEM